eukprot:TRINITY_DN7761_c0_g1_i1.p1 TRINITY_DN7761_c0_g1~~TRINITY_DN7761_c0_g1_i1.p1  ORF type:complete len:580 (-),score=141.72 TRINITY_DN7761_c0_g1_i1:88-1692(-)
MDDDGMQFAFRDKCVDDVCARPHAEELLQRLPDGATLVARLVTRFCSHHNANYLDINRISLIELAISAAAAGLNEYEGINCIINIASLYLPHSFLTDISTVTPTPIRGLNNLLRLLLAYHDPELALHLDGVQADFSSFTQDWICSLFARTCSTLTLQLQLLDNYFLQADPFFFIFLALALMLPQRGELHKLDTAPDITTRLLETRIGTPEELLALFTRAAALSLQTPIAFKKQVYAAMNDTVHFKAWVYEYTLTSKCIHVSALDVDADKAYSNLSYFVCDFRSDAEYDAGRLPTAYHFPPQSTFLDGENSVASQLHELVAASDEGGKPLHIVLCGSGAPAGGGQQGQHDQQQRLEHQDQDQEQRVNTAGEPDRMVERVALSLLNAHLPRISLFHRGYYGCHELFEVGKLELAGHAAAQCHICRTLIRGGQGALPAYADITRSITDAVKKLPTVVAPVASGRTLLGAIGQRLATRSALTAVCAPKGSPLTEAPLVRSFATTHTMLRPRTVETVPVQTVANANFAHLTAQATATPL